jgi:hypothetical protein
MTIWQVLAHFWVHHDALFVKFGSYDRWVKWNVRHFDDLRGIRHWRRWGSLWSWVNIHG